MQILPDGKTEKEFGECKSIKAVDYTYHICSTEILICF